VIQAPVLGALNVQIVLGNVDAPLPAEASVEHQQTCDQALRFVTGHNKGLSSYFGIALGFLLVSTKLIPHRRQEFVGEVSLAARTEALVERSS
jgi:hypothetical protein